MAKNPTRLRHIHLQELSFVDRGTNKGSKVSIFKRDKSIVLKGYLAMAPEAAKEGSKSFAELLAENEAQRRSWEANEELYPLFSALQDSLRGIASDGDIDTTAKTDAMRSSVEQFMAAVAAKVPEVEQELEKALAKNPATAGFFNAGTPKPPGDTQVSKGEHQMSDDKTKVADLEKTVAEITKTATLAEVKVQDLIKRAETAEAKVAELTKAADITKADEVMKVGETEIRKSAVGADVFKAMKAQQDDIQKGRDDLAMEQLKKRAESEFTTLPGEPLAKAKVLKAVSKMADEDRAALETMLKSGNEAMATLLKEKGNGQQNLDGDDMPSLVKAFAKTHNITKMEEAESKFLETDEGRKAYAKYDSSRKAA
jgi:hypothetical protein